MSNEMKTCSEPMYKMIVEKDVMVPARDGVKLAVDVFRPDAPGKFPGLFAISPYGKDTQTFSTPEQDFGGSVFEAAIEAGDMEFFVSRGYCYVVGDFRGTGSSEGELPGMLSKYEGEDGHDIIEWMAQQPWCNGDIGGIGTCYYGFVQLMIAETQPPHLKCIAPFELNFDDFYERGFYTGGVLHLIWYCMVGGSHPCRIGVAPKNVVSAMAQELTPEELRERVEEACKNPDLEQYPYIYQVLRYPYRNPVVFDLLLNPLDGPYYQERSYGNYLDKVTIPTWVGGPFHGPFGVCQTAVYNKLTNTPYKKLWLWEMMDPRPWKSKTYDLLRWYDYWLKGIDTGIMDEPQCIVESHGKARAVEGWPPKNLEYENFYLCQKGKMLSKPGMFNHEPDSFLQRPLFVSEERGMLVYKSAPLSKELKVAGSPILKFYASLDQKDTTWRVELFEGGHETPWPITKGYLRASLRKRVPEKDTPYQIAHDYTKFDYPIEGEIYEYELQLRPTAHTFRAGSQVEIQISAIDIPLDETSYDEMWHMCPCQTTLHKIYRDETHFSVLRIPYEPEE